MVAILQNANQATHILDVEAINVKQTNQLVFIGLKKIT
jgi:hypothetical protein